MFETKPFAACDQDGVIAKFIEALVKTFNRRHGASLGLINDKWREYRIEAEHPSIAKILNGIMHEPGFFADLDVYPDAGPVLEWLATYTQLEICTAPPIMNLAGHKVLNAGAMADKVGWLYRHFGPQTSENVTMTHKKSRLRADVLIDDDAIGNVIPWAIAHPEGLGYVVAREWNSDLLSRGVALPRNIMRGPFSEVPEAITRFWIAKEGTK